MAGQGSRGAGWLKFLAGMVITLLCLGIFFWQINLSDVLKAFRNFQWHYLLLGVLCLSVGYIVRIIRWHIMLSAAGARVSVANCIAPFLAAIALNNLLPLRLGDVIRAMVFPKAMGLTKMTAATSLIVERLIDLMTLLICFAFGLFAISMKDIPVELKATVFFLAAVGGLVTILGLLFSVPVGRFFVGLSQSEENSTTTMLHKGYAIFGGLLVEFGMMCRPRVLIIMLILSMLVWCGEAGLFYFVLIGSGMDAMPFMALLVMAIATLSTLVPSSPGYVGAFHLAVFGAVSLAGGSVAQSGSYAVIVHMALWLPTTLAGLLAIWVRPALFRAAKAETYKK